MTSPIPSPALDHLIVMADTLDAGVAWCEATLGVTPGPGGRHPLFGTHNRVLSLATPAFPLAYLEIIAIDPEADAPGRTRWFDLDDAALREAVRTQGPQLTHWVARVPDLARAVGDWAGQGIDRGEVLAASRMTPEGLLQWQIAVRPDGQRLMDGCLPTLIQWGGVHPAAAMPDSGLALEGLTLHHPQAAALRGALDLAGLYSVVVEEAATPSLRATLQTPRGRVVI